MIVVVSLLTFLLIISALINIFLIKSLKIQFKKINLYEQWVMEYEIWVEEVRNLVKSTYLKMKFIDNKDLFSKDDDVGTIFQELLSLLKILNDRIQK